jgi:hypothetical protein
MKQVKDGSRILQFEGKLIGNSTSWRRGAHRWVEFNLYKTDETGVYILSRTGVSLLYHYPECEVVERNKLREEPTSELHKDAVPCPQCRPDQINMPIVCPERDRHWAQVCDDANAVLESLMKYDDAGSQYLTFVAKRLLEDASDVDPDIEAAYRVQTIR